jgi:hypothetical protein
MGLVLHIKSIIQFIDAHLEDAEHDYSAKIWVLYKSIEAARFKERVFMLSILPGETN